MSDDTRLGPLLARWREASRNGEYPSVRELCRDCPELEDELRRLVAAEGQAATAVFEAPADPDAAATGPRPALAAGGQLGGFRLVRELGRGGMGVVYEAEDLSLHRRVALKTLLPENADEDYRKRFLREARAAAALRHEHVITVHQVGQDGDTPFLVMEYLQGETLADMLDEQSRLPVPAAVRIAREVAEGLAAAHEKGLVHRDVKPANIWLESPHGRVKLLDFGLARPAEGTSLTAHGVVAGTVGYMAPEQIYGGPLDGRTDLYALGCVLYRMLWGTMPFREQDTMALLDAVANKEAPNLDAVAGKFPAPLGAILRQLLARDPKDRPASAAVAAERLREIERALTPHFPAAASSFRSGKARSTLGIWAGAVVVLLAVALGAWALYKRFPPRPAGDAVPAAAGEPIRVGVLHSLSGRNKDSERPMYEAVVLATEEINAAGGIMGRPVELFLEDPGSIDERAAELADRLIVQKQVSIIFGCWSSSSRKLVGEVVERHGNLLVYSCLGEGLEEGPNTVYVGGASNQQLHEAVNGAVSLPQLRRKRAFLVGSDRDLYSRASHEILQAELKAVGIAVVGDVYVPDGGHFEAAAKEVKDADADVIFNTVDGTSNIALSHALRAAGLTPQKVPTLWLGIGEEEMGTLDLRDLVGDFAVAPYFESIATEENIAFVKRLKARYPARSRISDSTEAAYCAVNLWKRAVEKAASTDPRKVRDGFRGQTFDGPEGTIKIDPDNLYAWRRSRIAQLQSGGAGDSAIQFRVLRGTEALIPPEPFPASKTREGWDKYLRDLHAAWGGWSGTRGAAPPAIGGGKGP